MKGQKALQVKEKGLIISVSPNPLCPEMLSKGQSFIKHGVIIMPKG